MESQSPAILCARQPIFNAQLDVFAYELLFRDSDTGCADIHADDNATSHVILNAFTGHPIENLLEGKKGFVNFTRGLLRASPPISAEKVVIEILESVDVDDEMIMDVKRLKDEGYTIVLDDYVFSEHHHELLELADIIKIDVLSQSYENVKCELEVLEKYNVSFLAEKIEAKEDFIQCKELGFTLFQGYFLSKPNNVKGKTVNGDQASLMRFLRILQNQDAEFNDIEAVISINPILTYKLLRLINSAAFALEGTITSIQKALTILGLEKVRTWGSMLAMTEMSSKPEVLCVNTLIRAQMCRSLAGALSVAEAPVESLFMVGLLSTMDAFLDLPMEEVVSSLGLPVWIEEALIERKGRMGLILNTAVFYEEAEFDSIDWDGLRQIGLPDQDVQLIYQESILWAADIMDQLI